MTLMNDWLFWCSTIVESSLVERTSCRRLLAKYVRDLTLGTMLDFITLGTTSDFTTLGLHHTGNYVGLHHTGTSPHWELRRTSPHWDFTTLGTTSDFTTLGLHHIGTSSHWEPCWTEREECVRRRCNSSTVEFVRISTRRRSLPVTWTVLTCHRLYCTEQWQGIKLKWQSMTKNIFDKIGRRTDWKSTKRTNSWYADNT